MCGVCVACVCVRVSAVFALCFDFVWCDFHLAVLVLAYVVPAWLLAWK